MRRNFFARWYQKHGRAFPWRVDNIPPFASLLTEMLLRQTRAEGVAKIWVSFVRKYPGPAYLVSAEPELLYEELRPLGFGRQKAEALVSASNWILEYHGGRVPNKLDHLLAIPHVGIYAARAVLCFAFGKRIEIVDVNIQRFFARFYGIEVKPDVRRNPRIWDIAREALPAGAKRAQQHNYGLLDFTAEICVARNPRCAICPLNTVCVLGKSRVAPGNNA